MKIVSLIIVAEPIKRTCSSSEITLYISFYARTHFDFMLIILKKKDLFRWSLLSVLLFFFFAKGLANC